MYNILTLPGDGIGPEIISAAKKVIAVIGKRFGHDFAMKDALIGGAAIDTLGKPFPDETIAAAKSADAVLLGAIGGPKWDNAEARPESALLALRKLLNLYANVRPAKLFNSLKEASSLKSSLLEKGIDLLIVRELTGGIYFGEHGYRKSQFGREAYDTENYSEIEIERVARVAYDMAMQRNNKLTLVDKANVLTSSVLWRKVVSDINEDYPSVSLSFMYVDNAAMQLVRTPSCFDVILTSNMFGDILSDLAASIVGSIGVMPSASFGDTAVGMYEAIHGSAPDIAGQNKANPIGTILSAAMMLRHSFDLNNEATIIENAVSTVLDRGEGTFDIGGHLTTTEITDLIVTECEK